MMRCSPEGLFVVLVSSLCGLWGCSSSTKQASSTEAAGSGGVAGTLARGDTPSAGAGGVVAGTTGGTAEVSAPSGGAPAGGNDGDAGSGGAASGGGACGAAVGNWRFGDGNLYISVDDGCRIVNFCSIRENIHTTGYASATELKLDSVGGMPMAFSYAVSGDQLTIVDGFQDNDLQLARLLEDLPATCPKP